MNKLTWLFLASLAISLIGGCASRDMATVNSSAMAEKIFASGKVSPQYDYYYYGRESDPIALLALEKDYTIDSEFWTRVELTEQMLREWSKIFRGSQLRTGSRYRGHEIVSPRSKVIGFVYSRYYWITAWFRDPNSNVVIIPRPEPTPLQPRFDTESGAYR